MASSDVMTPPVEYVGVIQKSAASGSGAMSVFGVLEATQESAQYGVNRHIIVKHDFTTEYSNGFSSGAMSPEYVRRASVFSSENAYLTLNDNAFLKKNLQDAVVVEVGRLEKMLGARLARLESHIDALREAQSSRDEPPHVAFLPLDDFSNIGLSVQAPIEGDHWADVLNGISEIGSGPAETAEVAERGVKSSDRTVRAAAARALSAVAPKRAIAVLPGAIREEAHPVVANAMRSALREAEASV